jgi:hypothetical protein
VWEGVREVGTSQERVYKGSDSELEDEYRRRGVEHCRKSENGLALKRQEPGGSEGFRNGTSWVLMPIILAIWEAVIGRIEVPGHPGQKARPPISKITRAKRARGAS